MKKTCLDCKQEKDITDFSKSYFAYNKQYYQGRCKVCRATIERNKRMERRALENPELYMSCDDCDRPFYRYGSLNPDYKNRLERTTCKFCGSKNIGDY